MNKGSENTNIESLPDKSIIRQPIFRAIVLAGILIISIVLNIWNNDFHYSYHADERKKVVFIAKHIQDFCHPILMLDVPRVLNTVFQYEKYMDILMLGRTTTAVFGTLLVLIFFLMARRSLASPYDLLATLALASSPIIVMHSHYLKEDIIFVFSGLLSLFTFFRFVHKPSWFRTLVMGLATGLAFSAQYKGLLLLLVFVPGIILSDGKNEKDLFFRLMPAVAVALVVFLLVNYPIFTDFSAFSNGVNFELKHIQKGHKLHIYPMEHFFSFHLFKSIAPGMTPGVAVLAMLSLGYFIYRWKALKWEETIWLIFTIIFYLAVESTPMKAHPGYMRYVLPVIPGLIYFLFKGFDHAMNHSAIPLVKIISVICMAVSISLPLQMSMRLNYHLTRDTRSKATHYIKASGKKGQFERFSGEGSRGLVINHDLSKLRKEGFTYVVASSFNYDRYQYGSTLKNQPELVHERNQAYQDLFKYPFVEIKPDYMTFAFSNPTIRIVDITGKKVQ